MDGIRQCGDSDPEKALAELHSIESDVNSGSSDYIFYKYLLLKIRLKDKAYIMQSSSDTIERVTKYFLEHGDDTEQMEALYYEASVYRDLKDYPRSLKSFSKVLDIAERCDIEPCLLLQNTYSQLAWLYNKQQLYAEALKMAKAGCTMAETTNTVDQIYLMDVATSAFSNKDTTEAIRYCRKTLEHVRRDTVRQHADVICELLKRFSECNMREEADSCLAILRNTPKSHRAHNYLGTMAKYHHCFAMADSAAFYDKRVLAESGNCSQKLSAARALMNYYRDKGAYDLSSEYAGLYARYVDSVFIENQYEQTSRAYGEQRYAISLEKEIQAQEEAERYKKKLFSLIALVLMSTLAVSIVYGQKKKHYITMLHQKEEEIQKATDAVKEYDRRLKRSTSLINKQTDRLSAVKAEKMTAEQELKEQIEEKERLTKEITTLNNTIANDEETIRTKNELIKKLSLLNLLKKGDSEGDKIIEKFRNAAEMKERVDEDDWQRLYVAIEELYPGFRETVVSIPRITKMGIKTAYLMKIGMNKPQIGIVTDSSRSSVWERTEKIKNILR